MALPARRIPESIAHLDVEMVAAALIRHDANVRNAAQALGVPSGDLRKLVLVDQRLADAALEAVELRFDDAEANLWKPCGAVIHGDVTAFRCSCCAIRSARRKRGYAVAASAASLEMNINSAAHALHRGLGPSRMSPRSRAGAGRVSPRWADSILAPDYGGDDTDADQRDDVVEGELAPPATMIGHETAAIEEPEPAVVEAI